MPSYYRHHKDGYDLAHRIGHDLRHDHRPTRYIINEGKLVIDDRTLEDHDRSSSSRSNTVIYNAPGSTMWIEQHHDKRSYYTECRGCFRRRDRCYGGYCSECLSLSYGTPRRYETITMSDRRLLDYPERRAIAWR